MLAHTHRSCPGCVLSIPCLTSSSPHNWRRLWGLPSPPWDLSKTPTSHWVYNTLPLSCCSEQCWLKFHWTLTLRMCESLSLSFSHPLSSISLQLPSCPASQLAAAPPERPHPPLFSGVLQGPPPPSGWQTQGKRYYSTNGQTHTHTQTHTQTPHTQLRATRRVGIQWLPNSTTHSTIRYTAPAVWIPHFLWAGLVGVVSVAGVLPGPEGRGGLVPRSGTDPGHRNLHPPRAEGHHSNLAQTTGGVLPGER